MSVNHYKPHLLILPEDDANRQLANGFTINPSLGSRVVQIMPPSGGWPKVHDEFVTSYIHTLRKNHHAHLVLLIDFDGRVKERTEFFKKEFADVADRVYLIGTLEEPEPLRADLGRSLEKIGEDLAHGCVNDQYELWQHRFLQHNHVELQRLIENVKPFLFV